MLVDRTTEAISHFIGLFALKVEQERLRDAYEEFTAERRQGDLVPVEPLAPEVAHDHELRATNPRPKAPEPEETREEARLDVPRWQDRGTPGGDPDAPLLDLPGEISTAAGPRLAVLTPAEQPMPAAGVPGSMLTVTVQVARLADNDVVGEGDFRDAAVHAEDLAAAAGLAGWFHAPAGPGRAEIPTLDAALALHAAMEAFAPAMPDGVAVFTSLAPPAAQKIVNGQAAEEAPAWADLLPAWHQEEVGEEGLADWELPEGYRPNPDAPDGHSIVAGGNLLVNEANIALSYLDAPLIAVGGTWISLDIVSQVALVSNHDAGPAIGDEGATAVYQIVEVESEAKAAGWTVAGGAGAAPMRVTVEIVEGDLLVANTIDQIIELLDNDAFAMSILAANSAWILGANIVVNATSLVTGGLGFDLILVGGDFISIDTIHQTLVLLDDDVVAPGIAVPGAPETASFDTADARATEGRAETAAGMSDGIAAPPDRPEVEDDAPTADPAPDNLLVNKALLKTVGVDAPAALTESLAGILSRPADDLEALREKLMTDPALAGLEQARVLKINGDLILSNTINQTILAADRDDVLVDGTAPPGLDVIAGQNAMLNAAAISLWGVDSKVMTQTEVYSDLLIHQAKLVDEPDAPEVADPGLVNEAVAFLMDDIEGAVAGKTADLGSKASIAPVDSHDMMHGNLI